MVSWRRRRCKTRGRGVGGGFKKVCIFHFACFTCLLCTWVNNLVCQRGQLPRETLLFWGNNLSVLAWLVLPHHSAPSCPHPLSPVYIWGDDSFGLCEILCAAVTCPPFYVSLLAVGSVALRLSSRPSRRHSALTQGWRSDRYRKLITLSDSLVSISNYSKRQTGCCMSQAIPADVDDITLICIFTRSHTCTHMRTQTRTKWHKLRITMSLADFSFFMFKIKESLGHYHFLGLLFNFRMLP